MSVGKPLLKRILFAAAVVICNFGAVANAIAAVIVEESELDWLVGFSAQSEEERVETLDELWQKLRFGSCTSAQVEPLLAATRDLSYRVRLGAIRILAMCGGTHRAKDIAARWQEIYEDPEETRDVRRALIRAMGALGFADAPTINRLVALALDHEDRVFSQMAVASLGVLGVASDPAIDAVLAKLEAGPRSPRVTAIAALKGMAPDLLQRPDSFRKRVIAAVCRLIPSEDVDVNQQAALFLGSLGEHAASAVPALVETFRERPFARLQIAYAFGEIGPAAVVAIPLLEEAIDTAVAHEKTTFEITLEKLAAATATSPSATEDSDTDTSDTDKSEEK